MPPTRMKQAEGIVLYIEALERTAQGASQACSLNQSTLLRFFIRTQQILSHIL